MNVGAQCEITDNFRYTIRSHSHATMNQHLCCSKEGKQDTKEDKGTVQIMCNVAFTRTRRFARSLIITRKEGVAPVSLTSINT